MKKLTTLFTTTMIGLALMIAAPAAMADKGKGNATDRVLACAAASVNPASRWFGKMGACVSFKRADDSADKKRPPKP